MLIACFVLSGSTTINITLIEKKNYKEKPGAFQTLFEKESKQQQNAFWSFAKN